MRFIVLWVFAVICLSANPAKAPTALAAQPRPVVHLVSAPVMAQWSKVAWCETHGNWTRYGLWHDGGLGILLSNWRYFGGTKFAPMPHLATPEQQVLIATRINEGYQVPDQDGRCRAW